MSKVEVSTRFGPGHWVTLRDTGEHVKVEVWSSIAAAYRVRSAKQGLILVTDAEVDELPAHPDVHLGKHWRRCAAARCGAPLTPELAICPRCQAPICKCGRCACVRPAASRARSAARKKAASPNGG